ncbi:hypothetical protein DID78_01795 [Candidatus Marinamargulisbacteria bacterium SCGC AG-343-D04]|nr:hypothetical protein DID78_01795 [Candidatus Marinamargulisbacteria bacterium SCGC AG-343-D04]
MKQKFKFSLATVGVFLLMSSHIIFSVNFSVVKYLTDQYSVSQLMLFRFIAGPFFLIPYLLKPLPSFKHIRFLLGRTLFGVAAMTCLYLGFKYSNPGQVTLLFSCSIIWTYIASRIIFKEKPHIFSLWAIALSFLGLFLILRPDKLPLTLGVIFPLLGSFFNTGMSLCLKRARDHYSSIFIVLFFHLVSIPILAPFADLSTSLFTFTTLKWMCLVGGLSILAQVLMTKGYKYCYTTISSASSIIGVPLMYLSGFIFFNETLSILNGVGIFIVLGSMFVIAKYK